MRSRSSSSPSQPEVRLLFAHRQATAVRKGAVRILHQRLNPKREDFQSEAAYVVLIQLREDFATEHRKTAEVEEIQKINVFMELQEVVATEPQKAAGETEIEKI